MLRKTALRGSLVRVTARLVMAFSAGARPLPRPGANGRYLGYRSAPAENISLWAFANAVEGLITASCEWRFGLQCSQVRFRSVFEWLIRRFR